MSLRHKSDNRFGFSLLELLVVIGIIVLLTAILLPVVSRVRAASRSTRCLANLQQWGYSFQMYLSRNHGQPISEVDDTSHLLWWQVLAQYNGDVRKSLLCPDANDSTAPAPRAGRYGVAPGSATSAWQVASTSDRYVGSYAINLWTYHHRFPNMKDRYISYPARNAAGVPLLGDSLVPWGVPDNGGAVPKDLQHPDQDIGGNGGIESFCLDRHVKAVNIVFLDGHAEHLPLATLWTLRWSETSKPRNVVVPRP